MNRREPRFGNPDSAREEDWSKLMKETSESSPGTVHVHHHHTFERSSQATAEPWSLSRVIAYVVVSIVAVAAIGLAARWIQLRIAQDAMQSIVETSAAASARIRRDAAEARARADSERAERAAAERHAMEEKNARIAAVQEQAMRRERAWAKFYVPSEFCKNPDNRATMQCANEHGRAKREFDQKWAQGSL